MSKKIAISAILISCVLILHPAICIYDIWKELSVAESTLTFDENRNSSSSVITRVIGNKHISFAFNPKTSFFLYKREGEIIRIGHYWKNLSILEKKLDIPFVCSNFTKIQQMLYIEDTPYHKEALDKLDELKKIPLSLFDKISLIFDIYSIDNRI